MDIKRQHEIAKERQILAYSMGVIIDPLVVFLSLLAITYVQDEYFDKKYFLLGVIAFGFMFPGRLYLHETLIVMVHKTIVNWSAVSMLLFLIGYVTAYIEIFPDEILLYWVILVPLNLVLVNWLARILAEWIYSLSFNQKTVIIVGCNSIGFRLGRYIAKNKLHGMRFLGYFDDRAIDRINEEEKGFVIGTFSDVAQYCKENDVDQVYICIPMSYRPRIIALLNELKDTTVSTYFAPDIIMTDVIQGSLNHIDGIPVVAICETPLTGLKAIQKRIIDVVLSLLILLVFSPVLAWVAIRIKQTSPGPIIFVQKRYGLDGKSINVYKFRTMTVTEDGDKGYTQVTKNDARVTPFGAFLRKTSLDEFPQFVNVLQGNMSIVGPRPHVIAVNESYRKLIPGYMVRHKVKPGISGWAQVNGYRGGDDLESMQGRIQYDLEYLRMWSIGLDLWIIFKTVFVIIGGDKKAY